jgi:hypothetical protein
MSLFDEFRWAIGRVMSDWKKRRPQQNRAVVPASYSTSMLRHVREHACRITSPKKVECDKWTQVDPHPFDACLPFLEAEGHVGPFYKTGAYVCEGCTQPCVTSNDFIDKLGLDIDERTLRRYLNEGKPMPLDQFRRMLANATALGWLGGVQAISIHMQIEQMEAVRRGLPAVGKRAFERKSFRLHKKPDITSEEIEKELAKQLRILDHENTQQLHKALEENDWPPEVRRFFEEVLDDKRQGKK